MRVMSEARELETFGVEEENAFSIKPSGKAFRMLIDGLYSDKIGSLVREVITNAHDAQLVNGWKDPFYVNVPTGLRPEFFVRDYGVGMSHEKVMKLYTTLFESDKDETDDLVGAFGLGSKSPFAYADQFSITCYDGATARHYTAAIGNGGQPRIMLLGAEDCAEPQGVRVTVSVEQKDFQAFETAVRAVAMGFEPQFDSNVDLGDRRGTLLYEGQHWKCYENSSLPATFNVRQGCVIYPLTASGGLSLPHDNGRRWLIEAPIGTIEVTGSREQVQYKDHVVKFLQERVNALQLEVEAIIWDKVKDIEYVVDFFDTYNKLKPHFLSTSVIHPASGMASTSWRFNGLSCVYSASYDQHRKRWGYRNDRAIDVRSHARNKYLLLRDLTPLLDPSRDATTANDFTKSETRRISRLLRVYLEAKNLGRAEFMLGIDVTADFIKQTMPHAEIIEITLQDLLNEAPKRIVPPKSEVLAPPIRGLAIAMKAGDQRAVTEIDADLENVAWVSADVYRRKSDWSFKVANHYGIKTLYIASPTAQKLVEDKGVPSLRDAIDAKLKEKGVTLAEIVLLGSNLGNSLPSFGAKVLKHDEEAYDRLGRMRNAFGALLKAIKPHFLAETHLLDENHRTFLKMLYEVDNKYVAPAKTAVVQAYDKYAKVMNEVSYYHPTKGYINNLNRISSKAQALACVEGLVMLLRTVPLTMKFDY